MQTSVTLSWERSMKTIEMEGGFIPFNARKGISGSADTARKTIEGYMQVLLGDDFDGKVRVIRLVSHVLRDVQSLLIFPVQNGTGGVDVYVEPSIKPSDTDDFLNDSGMLMDMVDGHVRRDAPPPPQEDTYYQIFDRE